MDNLEIVKRSLDEKESRGDIKVVKECVNKEPLNFGLLDIDKEVLYFHLDTFDVCPTKGIFEPGELNGFMNGLVPDLIPETKRDSGIADYSDSEDGSLFIFLRKLFLFGNMDFHEILGIVTKKISHEFEVCGEEQNYFRDIMAEIISKEKYTNERRDVYKRIIRVRTYPDATLARYILDGNGAWKYVNDQYGIYVRDLEKYRRDKGRIVKALRARSELS